MLFKLFAFFCLTICFFVSCNSIEPINISEVNNQANTSLDNNIESIEKLLLTDSLNIDIRIDIASRYYSEQNFEKAFFHFFKVFEIDNKNLNALINLGNIYYDTQQFDKAIIYYDKALIIDKGNINVKCDLATCYLNIKMPEKAIEILKENVAINYNHAQSHYNLAVIYKQIGKIKESDEEMRIFNSLNSTK
jgi:tetratricopeptide (TPR) repeat protein